jgi:short-subunit dehydrogenase
VTVKPGFVDTAMTWGLPGMFLVASPEAIAATLLRAADRKQNVVYAPFFWRYIMLIIRAVPEPIFKKMKI